ncbi:FoF1 ATP synthase subunit gamma [soil metagenome]
MTERLADIDARIDGVRQLGAVVNAMRGVAAARAQQARNQLTAVDAYAQTIAEAMGRALDFETADPVSDALRPTRSALLVFTAEQGFAGAFSERVLDAVDAHFGSATSAVAAPPEVFLIGTRGNAVAASRGVPVAWQAALPSHSSAVPRLAERIVEALYARIAVGAIDTLEVIFSEWRPGHGLQVRRQRLFPIDLSLFPRPVNADRPLLNLAPPVLVAALAEDHLYAEICRAALHAFAAENEARMEAMAAARHQVEQRLTALQATQRRVRQDEITAEIIELAAGATAASGR